MYQGKFEKRPDAPAKNTSHASAAPVKPAVPTESAAPKQNTAPVTPVRRRPAKKQKHSAKQGTLIFYSAYTAFILIFLIVIACLMQPLNDWLIKYEASQPNYARDQVFSQLFEDPDWKALYEQAGIEGGRYETADDFAAYMEKTVGDDELTCLETSAGLSGDKKFIVKHGNDKIASFTLVNKAEDDIAQWQLDTLELNITSNKFVCVGRIPGQKVFLNGIEVSDDHLIRTDYTVAEDYLPEGVHGYRMEYLQINGLMTIPEIKVTNPDGSEAVLISDAQAGLFTVQAPEQISMTDDEMTLAVKASKAYAEYMIGKTSLWSIQDYYETTSQFYQTISSSEVGWAQNAAYYDFTDATFTEFYRYSDELFSVRIDMTLRQTRYDGSVKENSLNNTLFFRKNAAGKWMVMEATNVAVQEQKSEVRITFINDGQTLQSSMIKADAAYLDLPEITAPEGKTFAGWATQETDDKGNTTLTIIYTAENGNRVYLNTETPLEAMTLYAHFEEAEQ